MNEPWIHERIYAPYKIAALVEVLGTLGVDVRESLAGTGLDADAIYDPDTRSCVAQYFTVCLNAMRLTGNPEIPFLVGRKLHLSAYGIYGYALLCSPTLRDMMDTTVKYHRLATPVVRMTWRSDGGATIWRFYGSVVADLADDLNRFLLEQQLAQHVNHLTDLVGPAERPTRVCLPYPAPVHAKLYHDHLQCPVLFDQESCEIHMDERILDRAPQLANRLTSNLLRATCDRLLGESRNASGVRGQVYRVLTAIPGQFPGMEEAAQKLNMTSRTLRRKLALENTCFSEISDDVRCSFALEYLRETRMTIEDIASLIGFSDAANFRYALRKWTGYSPNEIRGKLRTLTC